MGGPGSCLSVAKGAVVCRPCAAVEAGACYINIKPHPYVHCRSSYGLGSTTAPSTAATQGPKKGGGFALFFFFAFVSPPTGGG